MKHEHLIEFLLKKVGEILCDARGRHRKISDELAVKTIRALFSPPRAQTTFEQGNDTVQAFVIRGMNRALLNNSKSPRVLVDELLDIMLDYKLLVTAHRTGNGITLWAEKWRGSWSSGPPQRVRALMVPIVALISVYPPLLL